MLEYLKNETNKTYTENGAVTLQSTLSECVDFFALIGGKRYAEDDDLTTLFLRAYAENPDIAMKLLFFTRDVREGMGERRIFRVILKWLASYKLESVRKNIAYIAEYGRYDDLLSLLYTPCEKEAISLIKTQLDKDFVAMLNGEPVSLLAKWLPSVNASNKKTVADAKRVAKALGLNDAEYRKTLSSLRKYTDIIENRLRESDYTFEYSKQPSKAMLKYRKAFYRNDEERYKAYLESVSRGEVTMHTGTLTPYDIVHPVIQNLNIVMDWYYGKWVAPDMSKVGSALTAEERQVLNTTWNALDDYTNNENSIVVVDGSGSMYGGDPAPIDVAISLGLYFAERNKGAFNNHFITFSTNPKLVEIKGSDIAEKICYCMSYNEVASTNIQAVFELILNTALKNKVPQSELPSTIYIVSDMEFNRCTQDAETTNFEYAKELFEKNGYKLPQVVFWNVNARNNQVPVTKNEQGVALVSGASPKLFGMITAHDFNPESIMLSVVMKERYEKIKA